MQQGHRDKVSYYEGGYGSNAGGCVVYCVNIAGSGRMSILHHQSGTVECSSTFICCLQVLVKISVYCNWTAGQVQTITRIHDVLTPKKRRYFSILCTGLISCESRGRECPISTLHCCIQNRTVDKYRLAVNLTNSHGRFIKKKQKRDFLLSYGCQCYRLCSRCNSCVCIYSWSIAHCTLINGMDLRIFVTWLPICMPYWNGVLFKFNQNN